MAYWSKPSEETVSRGFDRRRRRTLGPAVRIKIGRASGPTPIEERGQSRRDFAPAGFALGGSFRADEEGGLVGQMRLEPSASEKDSIVHRFVEVVAGPSCIAPALMMRSFGTMSRYSPSLQ